MREPFLSVVIPAYNEETNIRLGAIDKVARYLEDQTYSWEVIIVNDGSVDKTAKLLTEFIKKNPRFKFIDNPHQGKAGTVMTGVANAKGEIVLFSDLDQATPICEIEKVFPWFKQGFDVVIGSRHGQREGAPFSRRVMARGFMLLRTVILGLKGISDTQCGFKAYTKHAIGKIFPRLQIYGTGIRSTSGSVSAGFDLEVLYIARKQSLKVAEVPVEWYEYGERKEVHPVRDSWEGLKGLILVRLNSLRGKYKN